MFTYSPGLPCLDHRFDSERRQAEEEDPCGPTSSCSLHASWRTPTRPGYRETEADRVAHVSGKEGPEHSSFADTSEVQGDFP